MPPTPVTPPASPAPDPPATGRYVDVPLLGPVGWPPTGTLAFVVVLGGLVAVDILAWPVALAIGAGHVLARDHDHRLLREVGETLQEA
ncbi:hypothetical protein [Actinomycetospora straminea]|uniref:Uncharacterized protein n=1 Tax=Actinomycetospora straminea TaxID=663607 RepID=A0ABP9FAQ1_9PSEU|nr:hypothetical protein [Actinomycetospora straminea]MDD7936574.1 hypothetical protein [Actinomycetospora straminea]